jgi:hypothetical protein
MTVGALGVTGSSEFISEVDGGVEGASGDVVEMLDGDGMRDKRSEVLTLTSSIRQDVISVPIRIFISCVDPLSGIPDLMGEAEISCTYMKDYAYVFSLKYICYSGRTVI